MYNMKIKTYKAHNMLEAILPTIQQLHKKHKNPITYLQSSWLEIAPEWAIIAQPYMIRQKTLTLKTSSTHAMVIQYREQELLKIAQSIIGEEAIERVKIIKI